MTPLIDGMVAGYGIAIPVGAIAILILDAGIRHGFRAAFMAGAGAATADTIYAAVASLAGGLVLPLLRPFATPLSVLAGLLLVGLAGAGLRRAGLPDAAPPAWAAHGGPLRIYARFLGLTLVNPMTVVYFTAYILGRPSASPASSTVASILFVLGAGAASLSWQTLLAGLGGLARTRLSPRLRLATTVGGNLIVLGLGLRVLFSAVIGAP